MIIMIIETKIECECTRDFSEDGRTCNNYITKECLEAGENGGVCELLCVNKVLCYGEKDD